MPKLLPAILAIFVMCQFPAIAVGDGVGVNDIVNALDPATANSPLTRSFKRGIKVQQGEEAEGPPSIDLYVNFEFDSADLTADSQISLDNLGKALSDPRLTKYEFLIAGHTDAKGSDDYNQALSERRARMVRDYLVSKFSISAQRLESKGYGESKLLDTDHPEDGINRRVQILNVSATASQ